MSRLKRTIAAAPRPALAILGFCLFILCLIWGTMLVRQSQEHALIARAEDQNLAQTVRLLDEHTVRILSIADQLTLTAAS